MDDQALAERIRALAPVQNDPDWADVVRRSAPAPRDVPVRRRGGHARWRVSAFAVSVAVALGIALAVTSPWTGGPTVLQRAAAALAAPRSAHVLYENVTTQIEAPPGLTKATLHTQLWVESTPPYRYRIVDQLVSGTTGRGASAEIGGIAGSSSLAYLKDLNRLIPDPIGFPPSQAYLNPATYLRETILKGYARLDGTTALDGHKVVRVQITGLPPGENAVWDLDARTYQPIQVSTNVFHTDYTAEGFPFALNADLAFQFSNETAVANALNSLSQSQGTTYVYRFNAFTYLKPTRANLKLTNIQAEHPTAKNG